VTRAADTAVTPGHELTKLPRDLHREVHASYHGNDKAQVVTAHPLLLVFTIASRSSRASRLRDATVPVCT